MPILTLLLIRDGEPIIVFNRDMSATLAKDYTDKVTSAWEAVKASMEVRK